MALTPLFWNYHNKVLSAVFLRMFHLHPSISGFSARICKVGTVLVSMCLYKTLQQLWCTCTTRTLFVDNISSIIYLIILFARLVFTRICEQQFFSLSKFLLRIWTKSMSFNKKTKKLLRVGTFSVNFLKIRINKIFVVYKDSSRFSDLKEHM